MTYDRRIQTDIRAEKECEEKLEDFKAYIKIYQKLCDHDWEYSSHDSHHDYYECTKCTETKRG